MTTQILHYVPLHHIPEWEALGWVDTGGLRDTHHGDHATIMVWKGEGEPVMPSQEQEEE